MKCTNQGYRVEKANGTLYWYGAGGEALDETDLSGNPKTEYVFFGGKRVAERDSSGSIHYYVEDHLGSSRVMTTSSGTVCYDADFLPYGQEVDFTSTCGSNYKFTGKERDAESGLDNFGKRYDSSSMGRFISPDPFIPFNLKKSKFQMWISNPQRWNKYAYALNNPLLYVDPSGMTETIYYWLNSSLTDAQKKYFQEHKTEILNAIADKLKQAGIKDVVFKDGSTLSRSQVDSILTSQPKGVAFLNFANKSYAGVNAPPDLLGNTDGMRSAVFFGNLQGSPTAKERDAESGLDYFGARYYASSMGRWMSPDPKAPNLKHLFNPQKWNKYNYVLNNPLSNVDPDGQEEITITYRTFIAPTSIHYAGSTYAGDNRGFSTAANASSRSTITVRIETVISPDALAFDPRSSCIYPAGLGRDSYYSRISDYLGTGQGHRSGVLQAQAEAPIWVQPADLRPMHKSSCAAKSNTHIAPIQRGH